MCQINLCHITEPHACGRSRKPVTFAQLLKVSHLTRHVVGLGLFFPTRPDPTRSPRSGRRKFDWRSLQPITARQWTRRPMSFLEQRGAWWMELAWRGGKSRVKRNSENWMFWFVWICVRTKYASSLTFALSAKKYCCSSGENHLKVS